MAIPRPVPWMPLVSPFSSLVKASNILSLYSGFIPIPLSFIVKRRLEKPSEAVALSFIMNSILPPSGVYFTAFPRMFIRISLILCLSPMNMSCSMLSRRTKYSCFLALAWKVITEFISSSNSPIAISLISRVVFPLSILLISKTSLRSASRFWDASDILWVYSLTLSGSLACLSMRRLKPVMAFIGVLKS